MEPTTTPDYAALAPDRLRHWTQRLGRLRLGAEPLEVQVAKYRRTAIALTIVPAIIGLLFLALFSAFERPDIGLLLAALVIIPIAGPVWFGQAKLARRAEAFERECRAARATEGGTTHSSGSR